MGEHNPTNQNNDNVDNLKDRSLDDEIRCHLVL